MIDLNAITFEECSGTMAKFEREDIMNAVYRYTEFRVRDQRVAIVSPDGIGRIVPHEHHRELVRIDFMFTAGDNAGRNLTTWFNRSSLKDLGQKMRADVRRRVA
jgi:hypothetical protein